MKNNVIYQSDVLDFLSRLENETIDLAIIDPPYNMSKESWDVFPSEQEYFNFTYKWLDALLPKLKPSSSVYLFNNAYNSAVILNYLANKGLDFRNWITWYKKDGFSSSKRKYVNTQETILFYTKGTKYTFNYDDIRIPYLSTDRIQHAAKKGILKNGKRWYPNENGKLCNDVWEISSQRHKVKDHGKVKALAHPTIKPHDMLERMIKASSNEGDLVLDLFSGSGATSIVAVKLNRNYIGCELNPDYISLIESEGITVERF